MNLLRKLAFFLLMVCVTAVMLLPVRAESAVSGFKLGNEVLYSNYYHLVKGKKVGLVTNQSGVDSRGRSMIDILAGDPEVQLVALYGPEHGIDGKAAAGAYVESYVHPTLGIPVYSLYGRTRMPTAEMLKDIDVLLFDIQDIGARSYTYMSTLNYCMVAARAHGKPVVVLDRPNPLGGLIVEGPMMEDRFITFVGVDNLPKAHGMTAGELALFFNRKIGVDLTVVPMEGYTRDMIFQDTGLAWVQTSPNIPCIDSVLGYMATGLGEGTGIFQADKFKWIGGRGIDARQFANLLNGAGLTGVRFLPEVRGEAGGVRLQILDYRAFNPARAGIYALAYARQLNNFRVPKSGATAASIVMFDKIMGTDKIGIWLEQKLSPQQIVANYTPALNRFKEERRQYLLYGPVEGEIRVVVNGRTVAFDVAPFVDKSDRLIVPLRAIAEAMASQVDWDPARRTITVNRPGVGILFTVGSRTALVDGTARQMDTQPVILNGRTMVPARYFAEYLGARVQYNEATKTVTIDY